MDPLAAHATPMDFSLFGGGPWFRIERRFAFERTGALLPSVVTRLLAGALVAWVPLALLSLLQGPDGFRAFLEDWPVQAQMLFGIPILLAAELYTDGRIRIAAQRPVAMGLLSVADEDRYQLALRRTARWRDSSVAQAVLLLCAFLISLAKLQYRFGPAVLFSPPDRPLTPTGAWYFAISLPLFWLALLMWAWRFVIWSELLYRLSRLSLKIVPTHPDRTGGLQFLATAQASFAPAVFVIGMVMTTFTDRGEPLVTGKGLLSLSEAHAVLAAAALIVLHLPLVCFAPALLRTKRDSDLRLAELGARHGRIFERRWFDREPPKNPLGQNDFQTWADLANGYFTAMQMRWLPVSLRSTLGIIAAAVGSLLPRVLFQRQLLELAHGFMPQLF